MGTVYSWGYGKNGELGLGGMILCPSPKLIEIRNQAKNEPIKITKLSCSYHTSAFLTNNGEVYMCGNGWYGQLGNNSQDNVCRPVLLSLPNKMNKVSCGETFTAFLDIAGYLYITGKIGISEEQFNSNTKDYLYPVALRIIDDKRVELISSGRNHLVVSAGEKDNSVILSMGNGKGLGYTNEYSGVYITYILLFIIYRVLLVFLH